MTDATTPIQTGGDFERLFKVLGFDPSKDVGPKTEPAGGGVFAEAMREVVAERSKANKEKAVVLIKQAIELKSKWDDEEKKFQASKKKFFKDFGKVINRIEALARGESLANVEAKEKEQEKGTADGE